MINARIIATSRYKGIKIVQIYYFRETLYLYKVNRFLHVSCAYKRAKEMITKNLNKHENS